ncbi:SsrA-binding protein SmpB [Terricaulis sp.]|jgi:SsrA-binding protein|uniref:SsrA-binding protein SmpB n=1 Tax=Terricaulis sp. TaxID=2768686 RepID=UPI000A4BD93F|nr:SsrA-binding protein SmpB [Terricaulis sp.]MDZ4693318.1 SsrA-binding protein SmpB [Terricaulis sp.]
MAKKADPNRKLIAENRRARFDYAIEDSLEAGVQLVGTEVKSLRSGRANIAESYAGTEGGELWLINATIPEYPPAGQFNHEPRRRRKLLVRSRELKKLIIAVEREGRTIAPLKLYFNDRGIAKVEIALAKGKKAHDKREATKDRDWKRQQARLIRDRG